MRYLKLMNRVFYFYFRAPATSGSRAAFLSNNNNDIKIRAYGAFLE
jgi:hypothetical protein